MQISQTYIFDYYPGGMLMPGRSYSSTAYKYGFNGKEKDEEVKGSGNQQNYGMRIYDSRIARFLSVDPLTPSYPALTPYQFANNSPIANIDIDGLESLYFQITHDKSTGKPIIQLADVKSSYLDKLLPYHVQVSIDGSEYMYAGDFALSFQGQREELAKTLANCAKHPQEMVAQLTKSKEESEKRIAADKQFWGHDLWVDAFTFANAANVKKGTYTLFTYKNVKDGIGVKNYTPIASMQVKIKNKELLELLNNKEQNGNWVKVYEAGLIVDRKVEVHYFINKNTGTIVDPKIKINGDWNSKNFGKKAKSNSVTLE